MKTSSDSMCGHDDWMSNGSKLDHTEDNLGSFGSQWLHVGDSSGLGWSHVFTAGFDSPVVEGLSFSEDQDSFFSPHNRWSLDTTVPGVPFTLPSQSLAGLHDFLPPSKVEEVSLGQGSGISEQKSTSSTAQCKLRIQQPAVPQEEQIDSSIVAEKMMLMRVLVCDDVGCHSLVAESIGEAVRNEKQMFRGKIPVDGQAFQSKVYNLTISCVSETLLNSWFCNCCLDLSDAVVESALVRYKQHNGTTQSLQEDLTVEILMLHKKSLQTLHAHRSLSLQKVATWSFSQAVQVIPHRAVSPAVQSVAQPVLKLMRAQKLADGREEWAMLSKRIGTLRRTVEHRSKHRRPEETTDHWPSLLAGHPTITTLACSQVGSKVLQTALNCNTASDPCISALWTHQGVASQSEQLGMLIPAVITDFNTLATNLFGNYLVQKLLPLMSATQRIQVLQDTDLLGIAYDRQGTRVQQQLITCSNTVYEQVLLLSMLSVHTEPSLLDHVSSICEITSLESIPFDFDLSVTKESISQLDMVQLKSSLLCQDPHYVHCNTVLMNNTQVQFAPYRSGIAQAKLTHLSKDSHGWYVVLALLQSLPLKLLVLGGVIDWLWLHISKLSTHRYGVVLFKHALGRLPPALYSKLAMQILRLFPKLVDDAYGNYLLQFIIERNNGYYDINTETNHAMHPFLRLPRNTMDVYECLNQELYAHICGLTQHYTLQRYSANVIESILAFGSPALCDAVISEQLHEHLDDMILYDCGSMVVQRAVCRMKVSQWSILFPRVLELLAHPNVALATVRRWEHLASFRSLEEQSIQANLRCVRKQQFKQTKYNHNNIINTQKPYYTKNVQWKPPKQ